MPAMAQWFPRLLDPSCLPLLCVFLDTVRICQVAVNSRRGEAVMPKAFLAAQAPHPKASTRGGSVPPVGGLP